MDSKFRYLFVPDLYKFEQSFDVLASNADEALKIADEQMCCNCNLSVFGVNRFGLVFIGFCAFRENKEPTWITDKKV